MTKGGEEGGAGQEEEENKKKRILVKGRDVQQEEKGFSRSYSVPVETEE